MKRLFIDTETTGFSSYKNGLRQVSAILEIDKEVADTFNMNCQAHNGAYVDAKALEVSGITESEYSQFPSNNQCYTAFMEFIAKHIDPYKKNKDHIDDKFFMLAYNEPFDDGFLRVWFKANGNNYYGAYFWNPNQCVMRLAATFLEEIRPDMVDFKQGTVAKQLGIEIDETRLHDSMYDVELCREIYRIMRNY